MPSKNVELLEFFHQTFTATGGGRTDAAKSGSSVFEAPSPELQIESETLAGLLANESTLLAALASAGDSADTSDVSNAVALTLEYLEKNADHFALAETRTRRLLDFVYPVI